MLVRSHDPGVLTLAVHALVILVLAVVLAPLMALRLTFAPLVEWLIRATDGLTDALAERLSR